MLKKTFVWFLIFGFCLSTSNLAFASVPQEKSRLLSENEMAMIIGAGGGGGGGGGGSSTRYDHDMTVTDVACAPPFTIIFAPQKSSGPMKMGCYLPPDGYVGRDDWNRPVTNIVKVTAKNKGRYYERNVSVEATYFSADNNKGGPVGWSPWENFRVNQSRGVILGWNCAHLSAGIYELTGLVHVSSDNDRSNDAWTEEVLLAPLP
ncbi:MAG: hypothetical protein AB1797_09775 [bacterium]